MDICHPKDHKGMVSYPFSITHHERCLTAFRKYQIFIDPNLGSADPMSNTSTEPSAGGGASLPSLSDTDAPSSISASGPSYNPQVPSPPSTNDGASPPLADDDGATPPTPPVHPQPPPDGGPDQGPAWPLCECMSSQASLDAAMGKTPSSKRKLGEPNFEGKSSEQSEKEWAGYGIKSKVYLNASVAKDRLVLRGLGVYVHILGGNHGPEAEASADSFARALVGAKPYETNKSRLTLQGDPAQDGLLAGGFLKTAALFKKMPAKIFVALHPKEDKQAGTHGGAMGPHKDTVSLKLCWLRLVVKCLDGGAMQWIRFRIGDILYTVELPPVMVAPAPHFTNY